MLQTAHLSASFVTISRKEDVIGQIQLFKTKHLILQIALWPTAKRSHEPPVGHGQQAENH